MDDVEEKREAIKTIYASEAWRQKVDTMSTAQVVAIYLRFKREGRLG